METITTISELGERLDAERRAGRGIGFVPTMGFLHAGHLSLVSTAVANNQVNVVSIFVNPLQFAESEDLDSYPRDLAADSAKCAALGVDYLFVPSVKEMYPGPIDTVVKVPSLAALLEGVARPHHFAGVATVVAKLFAIVGQCRAYFGMKDWQQVCIVERMVGDLNIPVEVVACPTVREADGLAMSSRNVCLSAEERVQAPVLRAALDAGLAEITGGETDSTSVEAVMAAIMQNADSAALDYVAAVQAKSLVSEGPLHGEVRLLVAARFGQVRLIDNDGAMI